MWNKQYWKRVFFLLGRCIIKAYWIKWILHLTSCLLTDSRSVCYLHTHPKATLHLIQPAVLTMNSHKSWDDHHGILGKHYGPLRLRLLHLQKRLPLRLKKWYSINKTTKPKQNITYWNNRPKNGCVIHRRAIPFSMAKLILTFWNAFSSSSSNVHHMICIQHA